MARQRIRIRLKAYDHRLLDQSALQIVETAQRTGADVVGPVPLPTRIEKFTVIRSPFIDKDSREQFEIRTHKRLIDILDPSAKTVDALMRLSPAGGRRHRDQDVDGYRTDRPKGRHDVDLRRGRQIGARLRRGGRTEYRHRAAHRRSRRLHRRAARRGHRQRKLTKPRAGQLKDLPPVKHAREFRLDDVSEYEVGQTLDVSLFEEGEIVDVTGVSKGRASPARSSATASAAVRRRTVPTLTASPARSAPARTRARCSRARRMAGRMGNDRDHRQEDDHRPHRRRAQPAAASRARCPARATA